MSYLRRARVGRPGEQLIVGELRSRRDALRRTRAVVNVELAVRVRRHGQQLEQRKPILSQFDHAELDQTVSVIDDAPLQRTTTTDQHQDVRRAVQSQTKRKTHVDLKLPAAHGLVRQDFGERDRQTVAEKPLTRLAPHVEP